MPLTRSEQARRNGAKSKGPVSIEGKLRSSQNSTKHGFVADKVVVLQNELPGAFDRLYTAFAQKFKPKDDAERELVLQASAARWRLRRLWSLETTLWDLQMDEQREHLDKTFERFDEHTRQAVAFQSLADGGSRAFTLLSRYETRISREYDRAVRALDRLRQERENEPKPDPEPPQLEFPNEPETAVQSLPITALLPVPKPDAQRSQSLARAASHTTASRNPCSNVLPNAPANANSGEHSPQTRTPMHTVVPFARAA
jgi:hypothetical protein